MPAVRHPLLVLESGHLTSLATNEAFLREFPFLRGLQAVRKSGCSKCGKPNLQRAAGYDAVKQAIAGMASVRKQKFKEMLNADKVRVIYTSNSRKTISLTF